MRDPSDSDTLKRSSFSTLVSSLMRTVKQRMVPTPLPDENERVFDVDEKSWLAIINHNSYYNTQ